VATLRQRKNSTYYIDYRVNGRRLRKVIGPSKKIAELALKDIEVKIAKNEIGFIKQDNDIFKLIDEFITYSQTNHSPGSQKRYKAILDHFKEFLNHYPYMVKISHLTPKFFEDYKAFRKSQNPSNRTINIELTGFRFIFNLAVRWGYAQENPTKNVSFLKEDNSKKPRFLSMEESKMLLDKCGEELYPIFYTFLNTGIRKSELEHLEWSDIDFERRKIKIRIKDNWRPKTTEREIPINEGLIKFLAEYKEKTQKGSLVFHKPNGEPIEPNSLRKKLITITKRCGFPDVTKLHSLRHTFASHLVMNGVDLPTVKKLMGHSDIDTTMIYSHLADEHVDKAVEKLAF